MTYASTLIADKAFQNGQPFLSSDSIAVDETYRRELALATV